MSTCGEVTLLKVRAFHVRERSLQKADVLDTRDKYTRRRNKHSWPRNGIVPGWTLEGGMGTQAVTIHVWSRTGVKRRG
jgi:hypothetical protein